ncbi:MAG: DUF5915 domain-containing protein, partial [Anaerovoracaceae bacterium]
LTSLIIEELNVKEVKFEDDLSEFMDYSLKPNFKTAGPKLGGKIKAFAGALAKEEPSEFIAKMNDAADNEELLPKLILDGEEIAITEEMVEVKISAKEGFAVAMENNLFAVLDTNISDELFDEGLAREVVSKIQQLRKQKDFEMMDRIKIYIAAGEAVYKALEKHKDYVIKETLADEIVEKAGLDSFDINGYVTGIDLEKNS